MRYFRSRLWDINSSFEDRRWVYVSYDQLNAGPFSLIGSDPRDVGIVLIESLSKGRRRTYHKQKLALLLANQRQFALEQAELGVAVLYLVADSYEAGIRKAHAQIGVMECMEHAERELRQELESVVDEGKLVVQANRLWLTTAQDFEVACSKGTWRMDRFYRVVRRQYNVLIDAAGRPVGGRWSFDADNRERWNGTPKSPQPLSFDPDRIVEEVCNDVETSFADHPGVLTPEALPTTADDAQALWKWAKANCLEHFGTYEDAMSVRSRTLFHTLVSSLMNLGRLTPVRLVNEVLAMDIPLNSKEGFVRQVLGWREFVRHVHVQSDGFRDLPERLHGRVERDAAGSVNALGAALPLPPAFWGVASGFNCLDQTVAEVLETGYTHHINRLMILSNWAMLIGASPRDLTDWFWVMFTDAYDWVVEPNVLGMGSFAASDIMSTKPYISGSAYLKRMSDYCSDCAFQPGVDCPMTSMYWNFLNRHQERLGSNPRMKLALTAASRRTDDQKRHEELVFYSVQDALTQGARLVPEGQQLHSPVLTHNG
ncbi:MAG: cryptochrome/photolyase family protein [Myxococcota bacterium]|nr:cryptochrome/photolyase family protein [Myxococcota bacterium]